MNLCKVSNQLFQKGEKVLFIGLNSRLVEGKPTIISSNLTAKGLEARYSPRVVSRIMGGYYTIPFLGNDIRILKR